jgi:hypothetical protein
MPVSNPHDRKKGKDTTGSPGSVVPPIVGWTLGLIAAIGLFAWMVVLLRRRREYDPHRSVLELLEKVQDQEADGALEPGEYQAIRGEVAAHERRTGSSTPAPPS